MIIFISSYSVKTRRTWIYPSHNLDNKNCHAILGQMSTYTVPWGEHAQTHSLHIRVLPYFSETLVQPQRKNAIDAPWLWVIGISWEPLNVSLVQVWCFQHLEKLSWRRSCSGRVGADAWALVRSWHLSPPIWHIHVHSHVTQGREVRSGYQGIPYAPYLGGRINEVGLGKWDEDWKSALRE